MLGQQQWDEEASQSQPTEENSKEAGEIPVTLHLFPGSNGSDQSMERGGGFTAAAPSRTGPRRQLDPTLHQFFPSVQVQKDQVDATAAAASDAANVASDGAVEQQAADQAKRLVPQPPVPWPLPIPAGQPGGILEMLELRLGELPSSAPVEKCVADLALLRALGGNLDPPAPSPPARRPDDASHRCWACNDRIGCVVVLRASPAARVLVCTDCHRIGAFWYADWKERHHHH